MNNQSNKPGYGYQIKAGATSLTEAWDANPNSSQNHFMLGQLVEWLYGDLVGIRPDPQSPGFQNILIKPTPVGDIYAASASYHSVRGTIVAKWTRDSSNFTFHCVIPPNTTATIYFPIMEFADVYEGGKPIAEAKGIQFQSSEANIPVYKVGSGEYTFLLKLKRAP